MCSSARLGRFSLAVSVGYRVKSVQGTRFRQWATRVLREMLLNRLAEVKRIVKPERQVLGAFGWDADKPLMV